MTIFFNFGKFLIHKIKQFDENALFSLFISSWKLSENVNMLVIECITFRCLHPTQTHFSTVENARSLSMNPSACLVVRQCADRIRRTFAAENVPFALRLTRFQKAASHQTLSSRTC